MADKDILHQIHESLRIAYELIAKCGQRSYINECSSDTVFALGQTIGIISKAQSLVARDIDEAINNSTLPRV